MPELTTLPQPAIHPVIVLHSCTEALVADIDEKTTAREVGASLARVLALPARRRRPVTEPAEVMRALDALAARMPPAPPPGDPDAGAAWRRVAEALTGVLDRGFAAQRAGIFSAHQVAAIEVRINRLRRHAGRVAGVGDMR